MVKWKKATRKILPCTVSQLLSARQDSGDAVAIWDYELSQVSVVGVFRGPFHFDSCACFSVDDMTGPPLNVRQWINQQDGAAVTAASPGTYVKVTGSLQNLDGKKTLMARNMRCITDLNEISSHMLEVVHAHMKLSGKVYDVNMNTSAITDWELS